MKALRSPAVLVGLLALAIVLTAIVFIRGPVRQDGGEVPPLPDGALIADAAGTRISEREGAVASESSDAPTTGAPVAFRWEMIQRAFEQGGLGKLISKEEAERFLRVKGVTALNLLAAATATSDEDFTRRAASLFPNDPLVQLMVVAKNKDLPASERAEWIARFKASAPDNPLPFLYAAQNAFQQKDPATALAIASEAIEKPGLYLWTSEYIDASQQLYEFYGYSPLEAQVLSAFSQPLPHLGDLQKLGRDLVNLHEETMKGNDVATANEALRAAYGVGKIFQSPEGARTLINQLVGISIETRALKALPPEVQPSFLDVPRAQREAEITKLKESVKELTANALTPFSQQDPAILSGYLQRHRTEGEYQALLWLKEQIK